MSRVPSSYIPPPPNQQQQPLYYPPPPPAAGQLGHAPPPPPIASHPSHYHDPGVYPSYDRPVPPPPPPPPGSRPVTWNTGGGPETGVYPPQPGPSRINDPYAAYPQPHRASPPTTSAGRNHPVGWSSIHPGPMGSRPDPSNRNAVKLEDLVSQDQRGSRPGPGRQFSSGPTPSYGQSTDPGRGHNPSNGPSGATGGGNPDGGGSTGGGNQQTGPSEFIKKSYRMSEDESVTYGKGRPAGAKRDQGSKRGSVGWGRGGTSFVVWDMNDFTTKVLPQTFRHSNFSSFVRQLNKYGFSKIKHVDEDTGQIKDNVWEFQHPNFQAGGKADSESIKRKTVAPKKGGAGGGGGGGDDDDQSPRGLNSEEASRSNEMEHRVAGLEEQSAKAMEEVRDARSREMGIMNVVRDVITHLATVEKEFHGSPRDSDPSPRILHSFQHFDQVASGSSRPQPPNFNQLPLPFPPQPHMTAYNSTPVRLAPVVTNPSNMGVGTIPPISNMPLNAQANLSPHTDAGSRNGDGPSPAASRTSGHRGSITQLVQEQAADEVIELPNTASSSSTNPNQTLYNGEPLEMTPMFADTSGWLPDGTPAPTGGYQRRSSDGSASRVVMEALNPASQAVRFEDGQDPLDPSAQDNAQDSSNQSAGMSTAPAITTDGAAVAAAAGANAVVQQSPFGTLVIPNGNDAKPTPAVESNTIRLRRSTTIKPHWTQTPRILVVEDDVVYRQLSSKFLEKFGCITETVEDAQGAVEKMNATKYDSVLMDIFFGPSMDGRKATSLIRQFDIYTPIISMTSNVQTQDVDSYLQSGMNDVLAKPFTKNGLFGISDKHLIHLKAIQLSAQVPRSSGVPPLSDQGVADAVATGAAQWGQTETTTILRNPLAAMGWSDETYQIVLQQFMATGSMPDANAITDGSINAINTLGSINTTNGGTGAIGTSVVFGDSSGFNRKRSIETVEDEWSPAAGPSTGAPVGIPGMMGGTVMVPGEVGSAEAVRESKKAKR